MGTIRFCKLCGALGVARNEGTWPVSRVCSALPLPFDGSPTYSEYSEYSEYELHSTSTAALIQAGKQNCPVSFLPSSRSSSLRFLVKEEMTFRGEQWPFVTAHFPNIFRECYTGVI